MVELSDAQKKILSEVVSTRGNFFITGRAGTGKSTLLSALLDRVLGNVAVVAPTGIAALNVSGQTIHSFFRFPIGVHSRPHRLSDETKEMLSKLDTLFIDEVSMVSADLMDGIDNTLRRAKRRSVPFGGVQIVMFGDPYQLAPVPPRDAAEIAYYKTHYKSLWFFDAKVWDTAPIQTRELTTIHRQNDAHFRELLNAIRYRTLDAEGAAEINKYGERAVPNPAPITLATRNDIVDRINNEKMASLPGIPQTFSADVEGEFGAIYPVDKVLGLKVGARVMFVRNDPNGRWVNGTLGEVTQVKGVLKVQIDDDDEVSVEPATWDKYRFELDEEGRLNREVVGQYKQVPLRPAWAVTIHKSQGQTYDSAVIDLGGGAFGAGQTYVAISRLRSLDGLYLTRPLQPRDLLIDGRVSEFMNNF